MFRNCEHMSGEGPCTRNVRGGFPVDWRLIGELNWQGGGGRLLPKRPVPLCKEDRSQPETKPGLSACRYVWRMTGTWIVRRGRKAWSSHNRRYAAADAEGVSFSRENLIGARPALPSDVVQPAATK